MDVSRGVATRLTSDPAAETDPIWSSDGQELFFAKRGKSGRIDIFRMGLHRGASAAPLLESSERDEWAEDTTRDGETLLFDSRSSEGKVSLWTLTLGGENTREIEARTEGFDLRAPRLSPDGRWLAYTSNESGQYEVYVEPFRRSGERVRVSVDGGGQPRWRGDGRELFYRHPRGPLMAVEVREEPEGLEVGLPSELFAVGEYGSVSGKHYAVSADGQRFLVKVALEDESRLQLHIILNRESLLEAEK